jgi:hypothetical protein
MGDSARPRGTKVQLRRTTHVAVLIIGASGGLGTYAAQLGQGPRSRGHRRVQHAGAGALGSLGAELIDFTRDDIADGAHRYDLILGDRREPCALAVPARRAYRNRRHHGWCGSGNFSV